MQSTKHRLHLLIFSGEKSDVNQLSVVLHKTNDKYDIPNQDLNTGLSLTENLYELTEAIASNISPKWFRYDLIDVNSTLSGVAHDYHMLYRVICYEKLDLLEGIETFLCSKLSEIEFVDRHTTDMLKLAINK